MADNLGFEQSVKRRQTRTQRDKAINTEVIRAFMAHPNGRRWMWLFLGKCHLMESTISWGPDGYAASAFREGKRALGIELFTDICRIAPDEYLKMTRENSGVELNEVEDESSGTED